MGRGINILFIINILFVGCHSSIESSQVQPDLKNNAVGKIYKEELTLYREVCHKGLFSFCGDGIGQPYRLLPVFIKYNPDNITGSYDTIYAFPINNNYTPIHFSNEQLLAGIDKNDMLDSVRGKIHNYTNSKFCRNVNRFFRNTKKRVNCAFSYKELRLDVEYAYGGILDILLPDFNNETKSITIDKDVHVNYIISMQLVAE